MYHTGQLRLLPPSLPPSLCFSLRFSTLYLQTQLESAQEEKKSFSVAVETLKQNTAKVEQNYKRMKLDLLAQSQRAEQLEQEKGEIIHSYEQRVSEAVQRQEATTVSSVENSQQMSNLEQEYQVLQQHSSQLRIILEVTRNAEQSGGCRVAAAERRLQSGGCRAAAAESGVYDEYWIIAAHVVGCGGECRAAESEEQNTGATVV